LERKFAGFFVGDEPFAPKVQTGLKYTLVTLQRMETPVIYFYPQNEMDVSVNVRFPQGLVTEWYPQATQIAPSFPADTTNPPPPSCTRESSVTWGNLRIAPVGKLTKSGTMLAQGETGSHYYAARETEAGMVEDTAAENGSLQLEKFLFYRGV